MKNKITDDFIVCDAKRISPDGTLLHLKPVNGKLPDIKPGQFVNIYVPQSHDSFLRRPVSVCDITVDGELVLLVKRAGNATNILCDSKNGDRYNILLPLGNGFSIPENTKSRILLIGGGVGIAPLYFYSKKLVKAGFQPVILLGASKKEDVYLYEEFKTVGRLYVSTIDGSLGEKGLVTENKALNQKFDFFAACGPGPMMTAVAAIARRRDIRCEVSLENKMACGLGACLCCVEDTKNHGNLCVCKDGPVFNIDDLKW